MNASEQQSFEERLVAGSVTLRNWLYVLSAAVVILLGVTIYGFTRVGSVAQRQSRDERSTCVIQAQGLPAGHALSGVVGDIAKLLELKGPEPAHPTAVQLKAIGLLIQLRDDAQNYTRLESSQPSGRSC